MSNGRRNLLNPRGQFGVAARGSEGHVVASAFIIIKLPLPDALAFTGDEPIDPVTAGRQHIDKAWRVALTWPRNYCKIVGPYMSPYGGIQDIATHCTHSGTSIRQNGIINRQMTEQ